MPAANRSSDPDWTDMVRPSAGGLVWPSAKCVRSFLMVGLEQLKISDTAASQRGMPQAMKGRCFCLSASSWWLSIIFRTSNRISFFLSKVPVPKRPESLKPAFANSHFQIKHWRRLARNTILDLCPWVSLLAPLSLKVLRCLHPPKAALPLDFKVQGSRPKGNF